MSSNYTHLHTFSDQARVNKLQKLMWLETTRKLDRFRTYPRENTDSVIPPESSGQHDLTIQSQRNENTGDRNQDPANSQYHRALVLSRLHGGHSHGCSESDSAIKTEPKVTTGVVLYPSEKPKSKSHRGDQKEINHRAPNICACLWAPYCTTR